MKYVTIQFFLLQLGWMHFSCTFILWNARSVCYSDKHKIRNFSFRKPSKQKETSLITHSVINTVKLCFLKKPALIVSLIKYFKCSAFKWQHKMEFCRYCPWSNLRQWTTDPYKFVECATNKCISHGAKHLIDIQYGKQRNDVQNLHIIPRKYFKKHINEI